MYVFHNKRILTPNCQTYGKTLQNLNLKTRERASKKGGNGILFEWRMVDIL